MDTGISLSSIHISVGSSVCNVTRVTSDAIFCQPAQPDYSEEEKEEVYQVKVRTLAACLHTEVTFRRYIDDLLFSACFLLSKLKLLS